ncbi:hypothetical protein [Actinoplanes derwentensis]|uniref:Uncharacterized protein n=1 Tax=Actinoplanes derwentensis TaxID=113562 RepID=A0A1H2ARX7_9ACTN|nr:hypothetical protein [Actinoplanes derwentensis]GID84360.1 hypothetical protein Ade03nite_32840 [Actinoplanes derwentensis]SDT48661.1 hypothetical protein SAMN04489716_4049 [Actinoplanes derwentensis]
MTGTITRHWRSALVTLVIAAVVGGGLWYWFTPATSPPVDPAVAAELEARVTPLIEGAESEFLPAGQRSVCGVRVLGTEPAVTTAAEAATAYAWASCATLGSEIRSESVIPVRVLLSPAVQVDRAQPWDYSDGRITTMFPERLHDAFLNNGPPGGLEAGLAARIREVA